MDDDRPADSPADHPADNPADDRATGRTSGPALGPNQDPTYEQIERALLERWPETRLDPSLERIQAAVELLGDPQRAYRSVHLTGTNGKTSTSRMLDDLLRAAGLRTGRFTSPHLESMTERISVDGEPLSEEAFVRAWLDVAPYVAMVDEQGPHPMSFFEASVAMAYSAFADAPVDVAVVEVGMGGAWDATNVIDAEVAVITPISVDHARYLGEHVTDIAEEKAGIIKPNSVAVVAHQDEEVMEVLARRAREVGASLLVEGVHFGVAQSVPAVGGQMMSLRVDEMGFDDVLLPLFGGHQAQNAVLALAAAHVLLGSGGLTGQVVGEAFGQATSPGRLEMIRRRAHGPARRGAQPARRGRRGGGGPGLLHLRPPRRRGGGDGGQGRRGAAERARAGPLGDRLHPEHHLALPPRRGAGRGRS